MPHQINLCACGRIIHWPARARAGDTWSCKNCGRTVRLVPSGTPGADRTGVMGSSRAPRRPKLGAPRFRPSAGMPRRAASPKATPTSPSTAMKRRSNSGLAVAAVIGVLAAVILVAWSGS